MGFWSKIKTAIGYAEAVAPALPIPAKAKKVVADVGKTERDVEDIVRDVHPPKP